MADAYLSARPKAADTWQKYETARQEAESLENKLFGWVGPQKPHELGAETLSDQRLGEVG